MANTIKFGDGQWATKEDSILAYNDENANFKPLPFVTSRATTATRVNKAGLLETVASGVPRVDYLDNSKGSYLLEPASTNLVTQSEAFDNSYWTKSGASIEGDASTAGSDVLSGFNFTNWSAIGGASIVDSDTFNSTSSGGIRKDGLITSGKTYLITIAGTTDATSLTFQNYETGITYKTIPSGAFNETFYIEAGDSGFYLRNNGAYTTNVTTFSVKEVTGFSAPSVDSPLGAFKLVEDNVNLSHFVLGNTSTISGNDYTQSVYVKPSGRFLQMTGSTGFNSNWINYDLDNLTMHTSGASSAIGTITLLSNGFCRCTYTDGATSTGSSSRIVIALSNSFTSSRLPSYTGDGTSGVYIFGAQLEQKSYATSYIKTEGSTQTRLQDTASKTGISSLINSSEGTLFVEMSALADDGTLRAVGLAKNSSTDDMISIEYTAITNQIRYLYRHSLTSITSLYYTLSDSKDSVKVAVTWKLDEFKFYINGVSVGFIGVGSVALSNTFSILNFKRPDSSTELEGKVKSLQVFKTALSNSELTTLTTI